MTEKEKPVDGVMFRDKQDPDHFVQVARYADGHIELEVPYNGEMLCYGFAPEAALSIAAQIEAMAIAAMRGGRVN